LAIIGPRDERSELILITDHSQVIDNERDIGGGDGSRTLASVACRQLIDSINGWKG